MGQLIDAGADLTEPRHTLYYLYVPDEAAAQATTGAARELGFEVDVRAPDDELTDWVVICEHPSLVLDPDTVRANTDRFEAIAAATGGAFDGWEAAVTAAA